MDETGQLRGGGVGQPGAVEGEGEVPQAEACWGRRGGRVDGIAGAEAKGSGSEFREGEGGRKAAAKKRRGAAGAAAGAAGAGEPRPRRRAAEDPSTALPPPPPFPGKGSCAPSAVIPRSPSPALILSSSATPGENAAPPSPAAEDAGAPTAEAAREPGGGRWRKRGEEKGGMRGENGGMEGMEGKAGTSQRGAYRSERREKRGEERRRRRCNTPHIVCYSGTSFF